MLTVIIAVGTLQDTDGESGGGISEAYIELTGLVPQMMHSGLPFLVRGYMLQATTVLMPA